MNTAHIKKYNGPNQDISFDDPRLQLLSEPWCDLMAGDCHDPECIRLHHITEEEYEIQYNSISRGLIEKKLNTRGKKRNIEGDLKVPTFPLKLPDGTLRLVHAYSPFWDGAIKKMSQLEMTCLPGLKDAYEAYLKGRLNAMMLLVHFIGCPLNTLVPDTLSDEDEAVPEVLDQADFDALCTNRREQRLQMERASLVSTTSRSTQTVSNQHSAMSENSGQSNLQEWTRQFKEQQAFFQNQQQELKHTFSIAQKKESNALKNQIHQLQQELVDWKQSQAKERNTLRDQLEESQKQVEELKQELHKSQKSRKQDQDQQTSHLQLHNKQILQLMKDHTTEVQQLRQSLNRAQDKIKELEKAQENAVQNAMLEELKELKRSINKEAEKTRKVLKRGRNAGSNSTSTTAQAQNGGPRGYPELLQRALSRTQAQTSSPATAVFDLTDE